MGKLFAHGLALALGYALGRFVRRSLDGGARTSQSSTLAALANFSETWGGDYGHLLHLVHLELLRPGAGLWLQLAPEDQAEIDPWPAAGEDDPLEPVFGADADRIRLLSPEELQRLREGGEPVGTEPEPDLTQSDNQGTPRPNTPHDEWASRTTLHRSGRWSRIGGKPLPPCGQLWILDFDHFQIVPACAGVNYAPHYRATLLRAIAEAYRYCRQRDPQCPNARVWMLYAFWGCTQQAAGPTVYIRFKLAVACVAG